MPRRLRVRVDHDKCVGSTICLQIAPGVFALDENRQATVADPDVEDGAPILKAAEECPVGAIIVEDLETGDRLVP